MKKIVITTGALLCLTMAPIAQTNPLGQFLNEVSCTMEVQAAELTQSARWVGSEDTWRVSDGSGGYLKNCWFQDDVTKDWYLLGAGDDNSIMFSGLITDQSTGKTYLLNTNHDGTYGRMLTADGTYNINGQNVYLTFNQNHDGTFGAITSGLSEVRGTGVEEKQLQSIPSDNQQTGNTAPSNNQTGASSLTADEMKEADTNGDGIVSDLERDFYEAMKDFDYDEWIKEHPAGGNKMYDWNV